MSVQKWILVSREQLALPWSGVCKLVGEEVPCPAGLQRHLDIAGSGPGIQSGTLGHRRCQRSCHSPRGFSVKARCVGHVSPRHFVPRYEGRDFISPFPHFPVTREETEVHLYICSLKFLVFKWSYCYCWVDVRRGNLLLCFCCCLETQVLACICVCIHTNSSTCTQLCIKRVKHLPVFEKKKWVVCPIWKIPAKREDGG